MKSGLHVLWTTWYPFVIICGHKHVEVILYFKRLISNQLTFLLLGQALKNKNLLEKPPLYKLAGLKEGLVTSNGNKWKMRRKMIEPFFVSKQQRSFLPTMDKVFDSLMNKELVTLSNEGEPLTLTDQINSSTCDIIFKLTLNTPIEQKKEDKLHSMETFNLMHIVFMRRLSNPLLWIDKIFSQTELGKENTQMSDRFWDFFETSVKQNLDHNSNKIESYDKDQSSSSNSLINMLMNSSKGKIDSLGITEEIVTIIGAGHETTSISLEWTLFLLGKYVRHTL